VYHCVRQGVASLPAGVGVSVTGTLAAAGVSATPKVVSAATSVTALRVVTPGAAASQPSALRVTPVGAGVRSAGNFYVECVRCGLLQSVIL